MMVPGPSFTVAGIRKAFGSIKREGHGVTFEAVEAPGIETETEQDKWSGRRACPFGPLDVAGGKAIKDNREPSPRTG